MARPKTERRIEGTSVSIIAESREYAYDPCDKPTRYVTWSTPYCYIYYKSGMLRRPIGGARFGALGTSSPYPGYIYMRIGDQYYRRRDMAR